MRNPLSLEAFADWLGTMPAKERYTWAVPRQCAIGQWLRFTGFTDEREIGKKSVEMAERNDFGKIVLPEPHTFGAAHERARTILAGQP